VGQPRQDLSRIVLPAALFRLPRLARPSRHQ